MRNIILILAIITFVGCKQEVPTESLILQNEEVLEISHRFYKGECSGYCDTKLIVNPYEINYIKNGWDSDSTGDFYYLETIDSIYSISSEKWNNIKRLTAMEEIVRLDSLYLIDSSSNVSEGHFEIKITTNQRTKYVKFLNKIEISELSELNHYLIMLRDSL